MLINRGQFETFLNWLPKCEDEEARFISLSARNKYLSKEEREHFGLAKTEMFAKYTVPSDSPNDWQRAWSYLQFRRDSYITRTGMQLPDECLSVYMNLNPCNMVVSYMKFNAFMTSVLNDYVTCLKTGKKPNVESFVSVRNIQLVYAQQNKGRRLVADIDFDCTNDSSKEITSVCDFLHNNKVRSIVIKTHSGFHVSFYITDTENIKLWHYLKDMKDRSSCSEIKFNGNCMVPVPGTYQAGTLVEVIYKNEGQ